MCAAYTQTETRMDGGGAAAKEEYEHELEMNDQTIRELEEELAVSKRLAADLTLNMNSVERQVRKYAEKPFILWSDNCECRHLVSAVANLLKKFIITERDTKKSKSEATSGRNIKVDCETQTEGNSRQRDYSNADEQEAVRRLEDKNRQLSRLVEKYERKIVVLNEAMEQKLQDQISHIHHVTARYEEENQRQLLKMRDMRDELLWYKEQLPSIQMPTWLNG